ncbi:acyl carrier protein [Streptomyces prunicolor]
MVKTMTLDDLRRILRECAGFDEGLEDDEAALDAVFEDLGYDSLALMESAARIQKEFGVVIPDAEINEVETPRALLGLVNDSLTAAA